ncbi:MAG: ThuA domain-containing protein [Bryobacterales bacterium]|nr:ThuA domain-containing protein [Bryobacterales bacterium]
MKADRTSRRSALRRMSLAGVGAVLGAQPAGATAFALIGDENHNSDYIRAALGSTLVEDAGLSIDFTDEEKLLSYENLRHYKILILFRDGLRFPGGYWYAQNWNPKPKDVVSVPPIEKKIGGRRVGWMTQEQGRGVKRWVEEGGSLWAWHNNSQLSLMNKDYRDVEGAIYTGHPPIRPFQVKIVNREHPITKGVNDFVVTDEQHYVVYEKDPKYVLARSVNQDGLEFTDQSGKRSNSSEAVWAYDYGKGRVCFMAPGHMISALWNPEYEKMQKNAARWLLRKS